MRCQKCGSETFLPFKCQYCRGHFCSDHRLPESHECPQIEPARISSNEAQPDTIQTPKSYEYTVTYSPLGQTSRRTRFSQKEIQHLTVAAALVVGVGLSSLLYSSLFSVSQIDYVTLSLFVTMFAASFFIHEMAHKIVAQRYGLWAEFRLTHVGAVLTLISIASPVFKIISPGAVMVAGYADKEKIGRMSIAGPMTNIILSTVFSVLALLFPGFAIFALGAAFNAWISLFNLIPFGMFDGLKVFSWDKKTWALAFTASLILTLFSFGQITA